MAIAHGLKKVLPDLFSIHSPNSTFNYCLIIPMSTCLSNLNYASHSFLDMSPYSTSHSTTPQIYRLTLSYRTTSLTQLSTASQPPATGTGASRSPGLILSWKSFFLQIYTQISSPANPTSLSTPKPQTKNASSSATAQPAKPWSKPTFPVSGA